LGETYVPRCAKEKGQAGSGNSLSRSPSWSSPIEDSPDEVLSES
jgi:hypothetical protein